MKGTIRVTLSGSREGRYIVTEEHPDGSLVVVPDESEKTRPPHDAEIDRYSGCLETGGDLGERLRGSREEWP